MTELAVRPSPRLISPTSPDWDSLRATFNLLDDLNPAAIALPETAEEVATAIAEARRLGLEVVVQATGHNASALGPIGNALLINTSRLTGWRIDADARRVRVGAATKWEVVTPALSDLGLAGLHGSSPDVGIVGYSLGGGIGWLARKHGMQANAVRAIEVVTADGQLHRVDDDNEPDLFWALRGGNGNFGIVTALEFEVYPVRELYSGALFFPVERTREVIDTWAQVLPGMPEETTTWVSVLHFPPDPTLPDFARGQSLVAVMGAHLGDEASGRRLLEPLRRLGPEVDTFAMQPTIALGDLAMDPVDPLPYRSTTALLDELTPEAIVELAEVMGRGSDLALLQLRHGGGALSRVPDGAGARATLPGQLVLFALGVVMEPQMAPHVADALERIDTAVAPNRVGWYPNFVEHPAQTRAFFDGTTWMRLQGIKAAYDPDGLFRGNHPLWQPRTAR
jgi:FAD/FMN-containing dehydrogenase